MIGLNNMRERVRDMVFIALCAVMIAVCAQIHIPVLPIPYSMQNFGVFIAIGILGGRRAFFAIAVYLALGAAGLPVFAGFSGGVGRLLGETGGFLLGFLAIALVSWLITSLFKRGAASLLASLVTGQLISYAIGAFWYWTLYVREGSGASFSGILSVCVLPFLIPDIIKIFVAVMLSDRARKILKL